MKKRSILVVFGEEMPQVDLKEYDSILNDDKLKEFIEPGSIYEASKFAEELSYLKFPNGQKISRSFIYQGFELWWAYYNHLYTYFCLPYTQYRKLLEYLKDFQSISFYKPPHKTLFSFYLQSYESKMQIIPEVGLKSPAFLPFGVLLQIFISLASFLVLLIQRPKLMVFIGDKFEKGQDYDFRMRSIYQELRLRKIFFVEFIRSLESWKTVVEHMWVRKRPVIYSEGILFLGRLMSFFSFGKSRAERRFGSHLFISELTPKKRFKLLIATYHLRHIYDDVWAIRIMKWILYYIGVKTALFTAVLERNFHAFAGAKLNNIPTAGILHGIAPHNYITYDFLPGFDGEKVLSVDKYGLWSDWLKEYYLKNSKAYRPEQLYVSGPMRPLEKQIDNQPLMSNHKGSIKVLFVSEQLAAPQEVMPYLAKLLNYPELDIVIKFRPYRDGFEDWLSTNHPDLLKAKNVTTLKGSIQDAVKESDVVVGSHSTAVLEALLQFKVPIFFDTHKWGDCFSLKEYSASHPFFAENPRELVEKIKDARFVSEDSLKNLRERYFGDLNRDGSKWIVDQISDSLFVR